MKAGIYNPYWDSLGGGERYTIMVSHVLSKHGYKVDIEWKDQSLLKQLEERFGIKLEGIRVVDTIQKGSNYDVCFWVSDGSIPLLQARKNILHFQIPFTIINGSNLINKMKLFRVKKVVCNSYFTKDFIDKSFKIESDVLYPPVETEKFKAKKKENIILYVGRFSKLTQAKRQDFLIDFFRRFYDEGNKQWKMVLAGGVEVGGSDFIDDLKNKSVGYPIKFLEGANFKTLQDIYGRSKIFLSAAGQGVDQNKEPQKLEHFGITVVEAMAAGCIPVVFKGGGYKEIIDEGKNGYLWNSEEEVASIIKSLAHDPKKYKSFSENAKRASKKFNYQSFENKLLSLLE